MEHGWIGLGGLALVLGGVVALRWRMRHLDAEGPLRRVADPLLGVVWGLTWLELLLRLTLGHLLSPPDLEGSPNAWSLVTVDHPALEDLRLPSPLIVDADTVADPDDTWRVVFMGDSFTAGEGVGPGDDMVSVALRAVQAAAPPDRPVQGINLGLSGTSFWTQQALWRTHGAVLQPDAVVWVYLPNDLGLGPDVRPEHQVQLPRHRDDRVVDRTLLGWRGTGLATLDLPWLAWHRHQVGARTEALYRAVHDPAINGATLERFGRALEARVAEQTARGGRFLFVIHPLLVQLDDHPFAEAHRELAARARAAGAEVVDLLDTFAGHDAATLWSSEADHHPNAEGTALSGRTLAEALIDGGFAEARSRDCEGTPVSETARVGEAPDPAAEPSTTEALAPWRAAATADLARQEALSEPARPPGPDPDDRAAPPRPVDHALDRILARRCAAPADPWAALLTARAVRLAGTDRVPSPYEPRKVAAVSLHQAWRLAADHPEGDTLRDAIGDEARALLATRAP